MRIAMRALLGLDPDDAGRGAAAAEHFENALSFYGTEFHLRLLRGPGTPWRRLTRSRDVLDEIVLAEIARRRRDPDARRARHPQPAARGARRGRPRAHRPEVRDQVMTLMFAGHDTSTSTVSFLLYELARAPHVRAALRPRSSTASSAARAPTAEQLVRELPYLDMVVDEVLRLYPPAWIGPRRAIRDFEFAGRHRPGGRPRQLLLVGVAPDPRGLPRPRGVRARALRARAQGGAPRGAPTSRSAAAGGSASASASARPR